MDSLDASCTAQDIAMQLGALTDGNAGWSSELSVEAHAFARRAYCLGCAKVFSCMLITAVQPWTSNSSSALAQTLTKL